MINEEVCRKCCLNQIDKLAELHNTSPEPVYVKYKDIIDTFNTAPEFAESVHNTYKEITGISDPYLKLKIRSNSEIIKLKPEIEKLVSTKHSGISFYTELCVIGNMIDYGVFKDIDIYNFIEKAINAPYGINETEKLENNIKKAKEILYITDNSGEIFFDISFIKYLNSIGKKITVASRGKPILNDVTYDDARQFHELDNICNIISTGSGIPGIILNKTSSEFKERYLNADLVIAKGQGNYETLYVQDKKPKSLFCIFVIKCDPIANLAKAELNNKMILKLT